MLKEMQVINAVQKLLNDSGYETISVVDKTSRQGPDLIVRSPTGINELSIEAKGATSSNEASKRFNHPFDRNQIESHIGKALLTSMKIISRGDEHLLAGIALPRNHQVIIDSIGFALSKLGLIVFLVSDDGTASIHLGKLPS